MVLPLLLPAPTSTPLLFLDSMCALKSQKRNVLAMIHSLQLPTLLLLITLVLPTETRFDAVGVSLAVSTMIVIVASIL